MTTLIERLDARFVQIYEAARAELVVHEQKKGLIVVQDDVMVLFRGDAPIKTSLPFCTYGCSVRPTGARRFDGMRTARGSLA